jgi:hypothetical protein
MSMPASATCARCNSPRIRHARSHGALHRAIRAWSQWDRYACGDCGHRGWRRGKLDHRAKDQPVRTVHAPGRRAERRDARLKLRKQVRLVATVVIGLMLGVLAAYLVLRVGSMKPPQPPE